MSRLWIDIRNFVDFVLLLLRRFALLTGCLLNLHGTAIAQETPSSTNRFRN